MQEKYKIHQKFERERENLFVVKENYAYNGKDYDKFIVRECE